MNLMIVHFASGDPFLEGHDNFSGPKSCFMFTVFMFTVIQDLRFNNLKMIQ